MLAVHMDSGLGNQMLDYAEFMAIQKANPDKRCYLEKIIYDIPNKPGMFSMWNGYELERVFHIKVPELCDQLDKKSWQRIKKYMEDSCFWEENWDYSPYIVDALAAEGLHLRNLGRVPGAGIQGDKTVTMKIRYLLTCFFRTSQGYHIKRIMRKLLEKELIKRENKKYDVFREYPDDSFVGHSLVLKYKGFGIEKLHDEILGAFCFPEISDEKNQEILEYIQRTNSVAIHARRSDMLFVNGHCYRHGFFKRAVRYIKKKTKQPVFIFFTDENSVGWCEKNEKIFGLDFTKDTVKFVTWNKGNDSFRDMQLMARCKHNIFTESSFGFWGAYLNQNPDKITCAPDCTILATNSF